MTGETVMGPSEWRTFGRREDYSRGWSSCFEGFLTVLLFAAAFLASGLAQAADLVTLSPNATLHVRGQCPNWFDFERLQMFVNSKADPLFNFTRAANPERFGDGVLQFDHDIPIEFKGDTRAIVATIGEHPKLGPVMGPDHENDPPVAVSHPIFVDDYGGGFKANGDTLGGLHVKGGR